METGLATEIASIASKSGVVGVAVADDNGLCMAQTGCFKKDAAGYVQAVLNDACALTEGEEIPLVKA